MSAILGSIRPSLFFVFLAAGTGVIFAQPTVSELQNNYSYTQPGLPNYGISPGSLFIIKGSDLATTTNTSEKFPLTESLNGTSVSVTVNGVATQPTLYYILPTQLGAVLPEGTPIGSGMLTVSSAGQTSQAVPIQVVQSAFGILTYNGAGFGPAYAFDQNYVPITATHPAAPGQLIVLWGTGVGPDPNNDDKTEPQKTNNLTGIPMQVIIGGLSAKVYYKGRSAYPGVDEVFAYVPSAVSLGCYVSVVTESGSLTSNYSTIPVAAKGAANCSDEISILNGWRSLAGKAAANISILSLYTQTAQTATGTQSQSSANGQFKSDNAVQIYSELFADGLASLGSCVVVQHGSGGAPTILTAGSSLNLNGPGGEQISLPYTAAHNPPYSATLATDFIPSAGGTFTFSGSGGSGAQIGSFNVSVTLPPPVTWTNMSAASNIVKSRGFPVNWTGGTSSGIVLISGDSTGAAGLKVTFQCFVPATAGTFMIPPEVLLSLPDTTTSASLGVGSLEDPVTFSASGLDLGIAYGGFQSSTELANYQTTANSGPQLESVTLMAPQVNAGSSVQGTVTLSSAAPAAGVTVALSSSSMDAAVPTSVTIPSGSTSANFTITTAASVSAAEMVTITAMYEGKFSSAALTINSPPPSFNGTYTGSYSGTATVNGVNKQVSGSVTAVINNGAITVTSPGSGSGTITTAGDVTFGAITNQGANCNFTGTIVLMGAAATGTGTFNCTTPTVTGTWSATRE